MHGQSSARARLRALGLRPARRWSQSFLEDQHVAAAIVRTAQLTADQDVLEVGPGLGALTERLARAARQVVAVEIDPQLAEALREALAGRALNVRIETADVLSVDPAEWFDAPYTVVANLPYHITSPAIRHLLASGPPPARRLVLMVQSEVADRIAAEPGQMSALAVAIQAQAQVRIVRRVGAGAFHPRPQVDSAVLVLEPHPPEQRVVAPDELAGFVSLLQAGFKQPRKRLANSLADGLQVSRAEATAQLESAGIDPGLRPQVLTIVDWLRLFRTTS